MKKCFLLAVFLIPIIAFTQPYNLTDSDWNSTDGFRKEGNKIDQLSNGWEEQAKLIFLNLNASDFKNLKVTAQGGDNRKIEPLASANTAAKSVYDLSSAITNRIFKFEVEYKGVKGVISFDVTASKEKTTVTENPEDTEEDSTFEAYVGALAGANFVGNNKFLSNLTPIVNLGGLVTLVPQKKYFSWKLDINPYIGSEIDTKDTVSFMPALMLYGRAGLILNNYLNFEMNKVTITLMPFGFGLKFIPNLQDSNNTVIQHSIRGGIAIKYSNIFLLSGQVVHGWHNLTSQSKENFLKTFGTRTTDIDYVTVTGQFSLKGKGETITNYVYFEWRGLASTERYSIFTNTSILTVGIRKTLELSGGGTFAISKNGKEKSKGKKIVHMNL